MGRPSTGGGGGTATALPPSSSGSGDGQKPVHHAISLPWWPEGDPGRLRAAAAAWRTAAGALTEAGTHGSAAVAGVTGANSGPVFEAIGARWSSAYSGSSCLATPTAGAPMLDNLVAGCNTLASACEQYADHIEQTRHRLEELAAELVAGLVVGGLLTFVTAGISDAAAAAAAAGVVAEALDLAAGLEAVLAVAFRIGGFAIQGAIAASGSDLAMQSVRIDFDPNTTVNLSELRTSFELGFVTGPLFGYGGEAAGRGVARLVGAEDRLDVPGEFAWTGEGRDPALRRVTLRTSVKQQILAGSLTEDGKYYVDIESGELIPVGSKVQMGHRNGEEWWRLQNIARKEGWTRKQLIQYANNPDLYTVQTPQTNMSHALELPPGADASTAASDVNSVAKLLAGAGQAAGSGYSARSLPGAGAGTFALPPVPEK